MFWLRALRRLWNTQQHRQKANVQPRQRQEQRRQPKSLHDHQAQQRDHRHEQRNIGDPDRSSTRVRMPVARKDARWQTSEQWSAWTNCQGADDKCGFNRLNKGKQDIACHRQRKAEHHRAAQADPGNQSCDKRSQPAHRQHGQRKNHRGHAPRRIETVLDR